MSASFGLRIHYFKEAKEEGRLKAASSEFYLSDMDYFF
jgi:hypothetical protein